MPTLPAPGSRVPFASGFPRCSKRAASALHFDEEPAVGRHRRFLLGRLLIERGRLRRVIRSSEGSAPNAGVPSRHRRCTSAVTWATIGSIKSGHAGGRYDETRHSGQRSNCLHRRLTTRSVEVKQNWNVIMLSKRVAQRIQQRFPFLREPAKDQDNLRRDGVNNMTYFGVVEQQVDELSNVEPVSGVRPPATSRAVAVARRRYRPPSPAAILQPRRAAYSRRARIFNGTVCWSLEARGLGSISINVRITAVRKLAVEAAITDCWRRSWRPGSCASKASDPEVSAWGTGFRCGRPRRC
jgi:hypothetical protein